MSISDIIDSAALVISALSMVAAFGAIVYSNRASRNLQRITLRLDFSRRYQDIMLAMPDNPEYIRKYVLLYFDLCSEEYRLWKSDDKIVDKTTWSLWADGMRDLMGCHPDYKVIWNDSKANYISIADTDHNDFYSFFNNLVEESTPLERK